MKGAPMNSAKQGAKRPEADVNVSIDNIYQLDGRVPVSKAIPFGLQHERAGGLHERCPRNFSD